MMRVKQTIAAAIAVAVLQIPAFAQTVPQIPLLPEKAPQLVILSVTQDAAVGYILHLTGRKFCETPLVTVGDIPVAVANVTSTAFDILLPEGLQAGTYLIEISCGHGPLRNASVPVIIQ